MKQGRAHRLSMAHKNTHVGIQLMGFMRALDTVIKGEGLRDTVLEGLGEDVPHLVIKTHLCL